MRNHMLRIQQKINPIRSINIGYTPTNDISSILRRNLFGCHCGAHNILKGWIENNSILVHTNIGDVKCKYHEISKCPYCYHPDNIHKSALNVLIEYEIKPIKELVGMGLLNLSRLDLIGEYQELYFWEKKYMINDTDGRLININKQINVLFSKLRILNQRV